MYFACCNYYCYYDLHGLTDYQDDKRLLTVSDQINISSMPTD